MSLTQPGPLAREVDSTVARQGLVQGEVTKLPLIILHAQSELLVALTYMCL